MPRAKAEAVENGLIGWITGGKPLQAGGAKRLVVLFAFGDHQLDLTCFQLLDGSLVG